VVALAERVVVVAQVRASRLAGLLLGHGRVALGPVAVPSLAPLPLPTPIRHSPVLSQLALPSA